MVTITEMEIANICAGTYDSGYSFDYIFQGKLNDDTYVGVKRFGNLDVVAFRGSSNTEDWVRNFEAFPVHREGLGWIADGFMVGMDAAFSNLLNVVGSNWIGTGHSRGAAEVTIYAAQMMLVKRPPIALIPLAPPTTGGDKLFQLLSPIKNIHAYWNKGDVVPEVPPWCSHPYKMIMIEEPALTNDKWGPLKEHHIQLYQAGISKLNPMPEYVVE